MYICWSFWGWCGRHIYYIIYVDWILPESCFRNFDFFLLFLVSFTLTFSSPDVSAPARPPSNTAGGQFSRGLLPKVCTLYSEFHKLPTLPPIPQGGSFHEDYSPRYVHCTVSFMKTTHPTSNTTRGQFSGGLLTKVYTVCFIKKTKTYHHTSWLPSIQIFIFKYALKTEREQWSLRNTHSYNSVISNIYLTCNS